MLYLFWFENKLQAACDIDSEPPRDLSYKYHRVENCSRTKCECLPRHFINKSIAMIARFFFTVGQHIPIIPSTTPQIGNLQGPTSYVVKTDSTVLQHIKIIGKLRYLFIYLIGTQFKESVFVCGRQSEKENTRTRSECTYIMNERISKISKMNKITTHVANEPEILHIDMTSADALSSSWLPRYAEKSTLLLQLVVVISSVLSE